MRIKLILEILRVVFVPWLLRSVLVCAYDWVVAISMVVVVLVVVALVVVLVVISMVTPISALISLNTTKLSPWRRWGISIHGGCLARAYLPRGSLGGDRDKEGLWRSFIYFSKIYKLGQWQLEKAVRWSLICEKCLKWKFCDDCNLDQIMQIIEKYKGSYVEQLISGV